MISSRQRRSLVGLPALVRVKPDSTALKSRLSSDIEETSPSENNTEDGERDTMLGSRMSVEGDVERVGDSMVA